MGALLVALDVIIDVWHPVGFVTMLGFYWKDNKVPRAPCHKFLVILSGVTMYHPRFSKLLYWMMSLTGLFYTTMTGWYGRWDDSPVGALDDRVVIVRSLYFAVLTLGYLELSQQYKNIQAEAPSVSLEKPRSSYHRGNLHFEKYRWKIYCVFLFAMLVDVMAVPICSSSFAMAIKERGGEDDPPIPVSVAKDHLSTHWCIHLEA